MYSAHMLQLLSSSLQETNMPLHRNKRFVRLVTYTIDSMLTPGDIPQVQLLLLWERYFATCRPKNLS